MAFKLNYVGHENVTDSIDFKQRKPYSMVWEKMEWEFVL